MSVKINGSQGITNVTWTSNTRPSGAEVGQQGFNTTLNLVETWTAGNSWQPASGASRGSNNVFTGDNTFSGNVTLGNAVTANGTTGTSGQVLASTGNGVSWVTPSTGGAGTVTVIKTTDFTAVAGNYYPVDTSSGPVTVTLPASATVGQQVGIVDYAGTASVNNIIVSGGSLKIRGSTANGYITQQFESITFTYVDATNGWFGSSVGIGSQYPGPATPKVNYLIVAGGGGGGQSSGCGSAVVGGGGGAGGLLSGSCVSVIACNTYTITVGGGGSSSNGSCSSAFGVTSFGGGRGSSGVGSSGGSGGGGGAGGGGASGGSGTVGQGNNGGNGNTDNITYRSGGSGGGAGGAGQNGCIPSHAPVGGIGIQSSITGTSTYYAGGGGASGGAGGAGGGGTGSNASGGGAGIINTGGGGGSGLGPGNGGTGIVIVSYPIGFRAAVVTGSPIYTVVNGKNIYKFTGSGTIKF